MVGHGGWDKTGVKCGIGSASSNQSAQQSWPDSEIEPLIFKLFFVHELINPHSCPVKSLLGTTHTQSNKDGLCIAVPQELNSAPVLLLRFFYGHTIKLHLSVRLKCRGRSRV